MMIHRGSRAPDSLMVPLGALANMLAPLNSTMLVVALPRLMNDLGVGVNQGRWLITGYLIVTAVVQIVAGTLGDRLGRRNLVLGGLACFGLTSLGALSPDFGTVLFFRLMQAASSAVTFPNMIALVRELVPQERRARAMGTIGGFVSLAAAGGPILGGLLAEILGWRSIFPVNLILVIPALLLAWHTIPSAAEKTARVRFDWTGTALLTAVVTGAALLLGWSDGGWVRLLAWVSLLGAIGIFVVAELKHPAPVVQPRLFQSAAFSAASAAHALGNLGSYTAMVALPIVLAGRAGWRESDAGLLLGAMSVASIVAAPLGGYVADRLGRRIPAVGGMALATVATVGLLALGLNSSLPLLLAGLAALGLGEGLASPGRQTAALESVGPEASGSAAGLYGTTRYFGSIAGTSLLPVLLAGSDGAGGFSRVLTLAAAATACATAASFALGRWRQAPQR